jgi:phthalate 4,5-cis-dihydrodiol dehydrogenase
MTRLKFGLIGVGAGARNLLAGFAGSPHVHLVAVADIRPEALASMARDYGVRTYSSAEDLCADSDIEAVWVATPNQMHAEHTITALDHGKHVIVSKPMAVTLEECEAMNAAAERNGKLLLAGHSQAMAAPIRRMAELAQSGQYGKLAMVHTWHYTDWLYRPRLPAELDESQGGGAVFRQSPHQIDIVRVIAGSPVSSVKASVFKLDPNRPTTGAFTVMLSFASGAAATMVYSGYGHLNASELTFGLGGGPGLALARGAEAQDEAKLKDQYRERESGGGFGGGSHPFFGLTLASCERADIRQSPGGLYVYDEAGRHEIEFPPEAQRGEAEFEELYEAVVNGKPLLHDGRWGQATHQVTLAILESARSGREVVLRTN